MILTNNVYGVTEVRDLKSIRSLLFDKENYPDVMRAIENKDWDSLQSFDGEKKNGFGEYLHIVTFSDQEGRAFAATVYDNDELWQDPELVDIIQLLLNVRK